MSCVPISNERQPCSLLSFVSDRKQMSFTRVSQQGTTRAVCEHSGVIKQMTKNHATFTASSSGTPVPPQTVTAACRYSPHAVPGCTGGTAGLHQALRAGKGNPRVTQEVVDILRKHSERYRDSQACWKDRTSFIVTTCSRTTCSKSGCHVCK